jgi:hypothetical protein
MRTLAMDSVQNPMQIRPAMTVEAGAGFHGWEGNGASRSIWASPHAELEIANLTDREREVVLEFRIVAGDSRAIEVSTLDGTELERVAVDANAPLLVSTQVSVPRGKLTLQLHSDTPAIHEPESRRLAYQIRDLGLRINPDK